MSVVGGHDDDGLVPVAVLLDPISDDSKRTVARIDRTDRVVEVVVVIGPIDVSRLDHQPEPFFVLAEHFERGGPNDGG